MFFDNVENLNMSGQETLEKALAAGYGTDRKSVV